jgi:hypothetical protein
MLDAMPAMCQDETFAHCTMCMCVCVCVCVVYMYATVMREESLSLGVCDLRVCDVQGAPATFAWSVVGLQRLAQGGCGLWAGSHSQKDSHGALWCLVNPKP